LQGLSFKKKRQKIGKKVLIAILGEKGVHPNLERFPADLFYLAVLTFRFINSCQKIQVYDQIGVVAAKLFVALYRAFSASDKALSYLQFWINLTTFATSSECTYPFPPEPTNASHRAMMVLRQLKYNIKIDLICLTYSISFSSPLTKSLT